MAMSHSLTLDHRHAGKFPCHKNGVRTPVPIRSMVYSSCMRTPDGPAKQAGINLGDLVVSIDAQPVHGFRQLPPHARARNALEKR